MRKQILLLISLIIFTLFSCQGKNNTVQSGNSKVPISEQTRILYSNLGTLTDSYMFGQANARTLTATRNGSFNSNLRSSDSFDITGSHPAFIESDFMWYSMDDFEDYDIRSLILHAEEGGVVGYCWHFRGPEGSFYSEDTGDRLVMDILTDKFERQKWFFQQIDEFALPALTKLQMNGIPVILRPFHEMNGGWFWWGNLPEEQYIVLYRMMVDYLRIEKGLDNLLLAWSPNIPFETQYYPGDNYVDIVGLDYYEPQAEKLAEELEKAAAFAEEHGKLFALTETGYRNQAQNWRGELAAKPDFWTADIMAGLNASENTRKAIYVMSWYNADWGGDNVNGYTPYRGIESPQAIEDFKAFHDDPAVLFLDELPDLYE